MNDLRRALEVRAERGDRRGAEAVLTAARNRSQSTARRRGVLLAAAVVVTLAGIAGVLAVAGDADQTVETAGSTDAAGTDDRYCGVLGDQPARFAPDSGAGVDLIVYMLARASQADVATVGESLRRDPEVQSVTYRSQQSFYDQFVNVMSEDEELVARAKPEMFVSAWNVVLRDRLGFDTIIGAYQDLPGVEGVSNNVDSSARLSLFDILSLAVTAESSPPADGGERGATDRFSAIALFASHGEPMLVDDQFRTRVEAAWRQVLANLEDSAPTEIDADLELVLTVARTALASDSGSGEPHRQAESAMERITTDAAT